MTRFENRVALITGGASGIGAALAQLMHREGAKVVLADLNDEKGDALAEALGQNRSLYRRCDVAVLEEVEALVAQTIEAFGRIDVLANNAGIAALPTETPDADPASWRRLIDVNLNSVFYGCRAVIPHMRRQGGGAIVNTASIAGVGANPGMGSYNATKAAVVNYTRTLALDHAKDNIRINAICPGVVATPLTDGIADRDELIDRIPLRRFGKPEEMAEVMAFLASDAASYMTGSIVIADGGITAQSGPWKQV